MEDVSLEFISGNITAVIGPNGAGKSTLFNVITGYLKPDSGDVYLSENEQAISPNNVITGLRPHDIAKKGIGVLFQDVRIFGKLSALDNVAVGVKGQHGENPLLNLLRPYLVSKEEKETLRMAKYYLEYVGLSEVAHLLANQLSYGQQKLVAFARLLAGGARVLLLDEPTSGVHQDMITKILDLIQKLANGDGRTVVMIEHNLNIVHDIGDWVYLMAGGKIEIFGKPEEVIKDKTLQDMFPSL